MSCVFVSEVVEMLVLLVPEVMRMLSLYHMTVASGMALMLQVSVARRPVRTRCGPLTDVTVAGSEPRAEKHRSVVATHKHKLAAERLSLNSCGW